MSQLSDIADAIVTTINAASLSLSATAKRVATPVFEREGLRRLDVCVWLGAEVEELLSRYHTNHDYRVDLVVRQGVDPESLTEVDALVDYVEEMRDAIRTGGTYSNARLVGFEQEPLFNYDTIHETREFIALVSILLRKIRT